MTSFLFLALVIALGTRSFCLRETHRGLKHLAQAWNIIVLKKYLLNKQTKAREVGQSVA